jgi:hypothetical protein
LFHASLEKSEPTSAAPKAITNAPVTSTPPKKWPAEKFAAMAVALRPMVMPMRIKSARAPVFTAVSVV